MGIYTGRNPNGSETNEKLPHLTSRERKSYFKEQGQSFIVIVSESSHIWQHQTVLVRGRATRPLIQSVWERILGPLP